MLTQEQVRQIFVYEPERGMLRKVVRCRKAYPWRRTGKGGRYLITTVGGKEYYLHRLVWLYHFGTHPEMIDHKDGDTFNNRIENLRECTNAQNQYNGRRKVTNRSGVKGVVWYSVGNYERWCARITINGKRKTIGYFRRIEDAAEAYFEAAKHVAKEFARRD